MTDEPRVHWETSTQEMFEKVLEQIPYMIRGIAEARITQKAQDLVRAQNRVTVGEKDMVDALFAETPGGFIPVMRNSLDELGIDYKKYGYQ